MTVNFFSLWLKLLSQCWIAEVATATMAAEKITQVPLESIHLLETKKKTVAAEPLNAYVQVRFEVVFRKRTMAMTELRRGLCTAAL